MKNIKTTAGNFCAPQGRIGIVVSRFNEFVVESLLKGAIENDSFALFVFYFATKANPKNRT